MVADQARSLRDPIRLPDTTDYVFFILGRPEFLCALLRGKFLFSFKSCPRRYKLNLTTE